MNDRRSWQACIAVCIVVALTLLFRAWAIHPLFFDAELRDRVKTTIEGTAAREGWILSDVSLRLVGNNFVEIIYRPHVRGADEEYCHRLNTYNGFLSSCAL